MELLAGFFSQILQLSRSLLRICPDIGYGEVDFT